MRAVKETLDLPVADVETITIATGVYIQCLVGTISPAIQAGDYFVMEMFAKVGNSNHTFRVKDKNGVVLYTSPQFNDTSFVKKVTKPIKVIDPADFNGMTIEMQSGSVFPRTFTIQQDSIKFYMADSVNISDERGIKRQVSQIKFYATSIAEAINGVKSNPSDEDFVTYDADGVMSSFIWSANSGDTLYSWAGNKIGVII